MSGNLRGILWMALACLFLTSMLVLVRRLDDHLTLMQIMGFRSVAGLMLLTPWLVRMRPADLKTAHPGLLFLRTVVLFVGMGLFYYAIRTVQLADAVAIQFTVPLFTLILAIFFLDERVGAHRWAATAIGFAGALIIVRPGLNEVDFAVLLVVVSSVVFAFDNVLLRLLGKGESAFAVVFYLNVMTLPLAFIPAAFDWRAFGWEVALDIVLIGLASNLANFSLARAFHHGEASAVAPVAFLRLPYAAAFGFLLFGEISDAWTWIGAAIIAGATSYIARREAQAG